MEPVCNFCTAFPVPPGKLFPHPVRNKHPGKCGRIGEKHSILLPVEFRSEPEVAHSRGLW